MKDLDILSDKVREEFKSKLHAMRNEAIEKLEVLRSDVRQYKEVGSDPLDQAAGIEERNRFMAEMNRETQVLSKVEFALKNFEEFGFCTDCGEEISIQRLEINPAITTCIDCQKKSEHIARGHAH